MLVSPARVFIPFMLGIPDFLVFPYPYISVQDDYRKAEYLVDHSAHLNFEGMLRGAGFGGWVVEAGQARDELVRRRADGGLYLLNFGLLLAIGLLHLLLFWFYPRQRANLFFGLFACF